MKEILLDTNIILDIALKREPHFEKSANVLRFIEKYQMKAYVSATSINDIYYISRKDKGHQQAIAFISNLIELLDIAEVDRQIIESALNSTISDFEDAIQNYAATQNNCKAIVTRNKSDFKNSDLIVLSPEEFLVQIETLNQW